MADWRSLQRQPSITVSETVILLTKRATGGPANGRKRLLWSAGLGALTLVLGFLWNLNSRGKKHAKLISDLSKVGKKIRHEDEKDTDEYDVIICGGGTSGCVLASRLSEDPSIKVLLLEAGGSGKDVLFSVTPIGFTKLFHTKHDWDLWTTPQEEAGGARKYWPRAKLLGGCSSMNAMMAQYGSPSDFDEWANITGDKSLAFVEFIKYFRKFERFTHNPLYADVKAADRGSSGPVVVGYNNYYSGAAKLFVEACMNNGIPYNPDFNTLAGTKGTNRIMTFIDEKGRRSSTERAYLTDDVLARPNLTVAIHAHVTRILFDTQEGAAPRAVGVEFMRSEGGPCFRARARKEVVLCAGAVHSPHILMLSGVGPAEHLREHGIPVVKDLPGVGSNLVDHPEVNIFFKMKENLSMKYLSQGTFLDSLKYLKSAVQYLMLGTGDMTTNFAESVAFFRLDDPALFPTHEFPETIEDSTSGPEGPDIELIYTPIAALEHGKRVILQQFQTFEINTYLLRPTSIGNVRLKSANPWSQPDINPNYLRTKHDLDALVRGVRTALKIAHTEPLRSVIDHEAKHPLLDTHLHLASAAELEQLVRRRTETMYHPASTCRMAPLADGGVLDSRHRVYGIANLRVCDAAAFPSIVSGHPTGACIALGERLADIMKAELK